MLMLSLFGRCKPRAVREKKNGSEAGKDGKPCEGTVYHAGFCSRVAEKSSSLGTCIHSAPETFLNGLHRELCL